LAEIIKRLCLAARHLRRMSIELPPPDTKRWTVRRKAAVVQAVRVGLISLEEARLRYGLSVEELFGWQRAVEQHGIRGLRVTRLQIYRDAEELRSAKGTHDDGR
jgi:transposase-like protein